MRAVGYYRNYTVEANYQSLKRSLGKINRFIIVYYV